MQDIRTHIIYLCAIFIMMGFGILIGEGLYPSQTRQQAQTLAGLRVQVDEVLQDNKASKDQIDKLEGAFDALRPQAVHGKLTGKRVIVVQTGDSHDAVESAVTALNDAGADVITVTLNPSITDPSTTQRIAPGDTGADGTPVSVFQLLAAILAQGTAKNQGNEVLLEKMETLGLVNVDGDLDQTTNLFVLVGGQTDAPTGQDDDDPAVSLDIPLIQNLTAVSRNKATIVGCEPFDAGLSYMPDYQRAGIGTVDCIDLPVGQFALPFVLRGGQDKDDYGLKNTANRLMPASLVGNGTS